MPDTELYQDHLSGGGDMLVMCLGYLGCPQIYCCKGQEG